MKEHKFISEILKKEVTPALGCTEPVAIALATAKARSIIGGMPKKIKIAVSGNVFKNALAVGIPGTDRVGLDIAASLGAFAGNSEKGLEVLENVEEGLQSAIEFTERGNVNVVLDPRAGIYIEALVQTAKGSGRCIIEDAHTNIIFLEIINEKGSKVLLDKKSSLDNVLDHQSVLEWLMKQKVARIIELVQTIPLSEIMFLLDGAEMNLLVAQKGLEEKAGMGVGFFTNHQDLPLGNYAATLTSAACDVRMAGFKMPVMSSAGSGNHGLSAILPVVAVAERLDKKNEELIRALAISHLITIYIKLFTGKLSPVCGCAVAAGAGAAAAIAFLLGGDREIIENSIKNVVANLTGMICDGGKVGCSLKLHNAAISAYLSADLALLGAVIPADNGIVDQSVEQTISNLGQLSYPGMEETDQIILQIMLQKRNIGCY